MPFEIAQQEPQVEVGQFQKYADALLRGCEVTGPTTCLKMGNNSCALGAMAVGLGIPHDYEPLLEWVKSDEAWAVCSAYKQRYGSFLRGDNDSRKFTREQIAARIAALR